MKTKVLISCSVTVHMQKFDFLMTQLNCEYVLTSQSKMPMNSNTCTRLHWRQSQYYETRYAPLVKLFKCQLTLLLTGDALGIYPRNNPPEVKRLLDAMQCNGTETVAKPSFAYSCDNSYGKIWLNMEGWMIW